MKDLLSIFVLYIQLSLVWIYFINNDGSKIA